MPKVLIIDDDDGMRGVLSELFSHAAFEILEAKDGQEGLHVFQSEAPDLVVTDVLMPEKDGFQLAKEIRTLDTETPIICYSGAFAGDPEGAKKQAIDSGANDYLSKPIRFDDLLGAANKTLKEADSSRQVVLLVEDDEGLCRMLEHTLQEAGMKVRTARTGVEALEAFQKEPTDLVITDLLMPEKSGLELIAELRHLNPDVRVIAMSGVPTEAKSLIEKPSTYGALYFLKKPFSCRTIVKAAQEALASKK